MVSDELLQAKTSRRQAERKWTASGIVVYKELYKKAKPCVTRIVMKAKSLFYNCEIIFASSTKELYSITNNLLSKTKSTPLPTLFPLPDLPGLFSTFFRDKIIKLRLDLDSQPVATSSLPLTNTFDGVSLCTFKPVSESVVRNLILKSAPKPCQLDPIPTPLVVECLDTLLPSLTALVNSSLSSGVFPEVLKTALVISLFKKISLDQNELKNYRPVSNLSFVSKIIEKLFFLSSLTTSLPTISTTAPVCLPTRIQYQNCTSKSSQ